jgi:hypothetical protein
VSEMTSSDAENNVSDANDDAATHPVAHAA